MNEVSVDYINRAEIWLLVSMLAYFMMNGAQLFETFVIIPKWTSRPPASLVSIRGEFAPDFRRFWIVFHSVHEITFILAIIMCWNLDQIRIWLIVLFCFHFAVRVWTIGYFAPKIMGFQRADNSSTPATLQNTVSIWKNFNYIRVAIFVAISFCIGIVYNQLRNIPSSKNLTTKNTVMEPRLSVITLGVDNLQAQVEFYKSKIGWKAVAENKDIVFFKLNGFLFSLLDRKALAASCGISAEGSGFRSLTLSQNLATKEEVDKMFQVIKTKGVKILKEPTTTPFGGYYFIFSDPENNVLEVAFIPTYRWISMAM